MGQDERTMAPCDALATIAYCVLNFRGQTTDPTLHDIMLAVVQAAPLLNLPDYSKAHDIEISAAVKLIERHDWSHPTTAVLVCQTTTPRRGDPAGC